MFFSAVFQNKYMLELKPWLLKTRVHCLFFIEQQTNLTDVLLDLKTRTEAQMTKKKNHRNKKLQDAWAGNELLVSVLGSLIKAQREKMNQNMSTSRQPMGNNTWLDNCVFSSVYMQCLCHSIGNFLGILFKKYLKSFPRRYI